MATYKIVAVNPLKPFPLPSFGLANVTSLDDAKSQIKKAKGGEEERIAALEARWAEGKIEPALKAHLARQKRRLAHFETSCRVLVCGNPRRQKRGNGGERGAKANRPGVKPLFCGGHVNLRKCLTREMLAELYAASEKRVVAIV